jgi:hypothetical protein
MTGQRHLRRLVAAGAINAGHALQALLAEAESDAAALVIVSDLAARGNGKESLRAIFSALGEGQLPTFWVPRAADAPISAYLRESYNMEIVHPHLHGVTEPSRSARGACCSPGWAASSWTSRKPVDSRMSGCGTPPGSSSTA